MKEGKRLELLEIIRNLYYTRKNLRNSLDISKIEKETETNLEILLYELRIIERKLISFANSN